MRKWVSIFWALAVLAVFSFGCAGISRETKLKCPKCGARFTPDQGLREMLSGLPEFPWPPPRASATANLPNEFLRASKKGIVLLRDADNHLSDALRDAGYVEKSYYAVPHGFALVARLEQINFDGTSKTGADRWAVEVGPLREFSLSTYLRALFTSETGYFRVIVFVITPCPFSRSDVKVSRDEAIDWVHGGFNRLPNSVGIRTYTEEYVCTALIYEFEKERGKNAANILIPGRLSAATHLEQSGIMSGLRKKI